MPSRRSKRVGRAARANTRMKRLKIASVEPVDTGKLATVARILSELPPPSPTPTPAQVVVPVPAPPKGDKLLGESTLKLQEYGLSHGTAYLLWDNGFPKIRDILTQGEKEVAAVRGFGKTKMEQLKAAMEKASITFAK